QVQATVEVTVLPLPDAAPSFTMAEGCAPVEVTFTSGYAGDGSCHWDFGNGTDTTACGPITITYDQPGNYVVHFTANPGNGCAESTQIDQLVQVVDKPTAAFSIVGQVISTHNPIAAFSNASTGAGQYIWDFGGIGTSTAVNPQFTFPYEVEAASPTGLVAVASLTFAYTGCSELWVPASASVFTQNAFTPDGDDINDTFAPVSMGLDPDDYLFIIVDRWGQVIFSTEDMHARWDGKHRNGTPAEIGVYVWKLTGQDMIS